MSYGLSRSSRVLAAAAGSVCVCVLAAAPAGAAYEPMTRTFTSGTFGDGVQYPRHLNPSRPTGGGASVANAWANGIGFHNVSGNPAYFDSNNLLTRPASLITNEAFWTDAKVGPVGAASFGMTFTTDAEASDTFSFDLAMASVSQDLPLAGYGPGNTGAAYLTFSVEDYNHHSAWGVLIFNDQVASGGELFYASQAGTFQTLNSPRTAYEARFELTHQSLMDMIVEQEGIDASEVTPIWLFNIGLHGVATGGGTTQVAMDHFVVNGGDPDRPVETPDALTYQPLQPVGANTPIYLIIDALADYGDLPEGSYAVADTPEDGQAMSLVGKIGQAVSQISGETIEMSVVLPSGSDLLGGVERLEIVSPELTQAMLDAVSAAAANGEGGLGAPIQITPVTSDTGDPASGSLLAKITSKVSEVIGMQLAALRAEDEAAYEALIAGLNEDRQRIELTNVAKATLDSVTRFMTRVVEVTSGGGPEGLRFAELSLLEDESAFGAELFVGYSLSEYLALMQEDGLSPRIGDTGGYYEAVYDADGNVIDLIAHSWIVADGAGTFVATSYINIPEPATAGVVALAGAAGLFARRRRRGG